ncbi:GAP1-N2 domain-containing protein [Paenibacillus eucommiae]|uniref:Glycosyltransferase n=1 Tax=Paenibacillus eucommiae TaxID=1355755 RepID=A0ABS4IY02_9BACL|nr:hypothetical protein [Paenibacillus eucommiae]MBP1992467.1 hypothetical protein [Paenibacillus eucommiae]
MNTESKILQQVYTRGREGIFRTNEGLDTIAKSPSLDNGFIKKTLHPFCVYHAPQELRQRGEQDLSLYPESLTVFHVDSGELVIGRSIFAGADFTGQRDTIFVHNYIFPPDRVESMLRQVSPMFRIEHFESHYDAQSGKILPELDHLEYNQDSHLESQQAVLDKLGIDERVFKQLLWAIMMSISSNKKVYIALDVDVTQSSLYANLLLEIMFHCLPYEMRRHFGFTTYSNEPQGKKHINVMFVEKGSIRGGDRNLDKDYLFDFENRRFVNVGLQEQNQYYLDFAWDHKERPEVLTAFYEFAEEALQGSDSSKTLAIATYYQLSALFLVQLGDTAIYRDNKEGVISSILSYLDADTMPLKPRMSELIWKLVAEEISLIQNGSTPSLEYLNGLMHFYRISGEKAKSKLVTSLVYFLYNGWQHHEDPSYTPEVFQAMQKQPELFKSVIALMHTQERFTKVYEDYIQSRMQKLTSVKGLQEEILFWVMNAEDAATSLFFKEQCLRKIKELLEKSDSSDKSEKIAAGKSMCEFLDQLYEKTNKNANKKQYESFCDDIELWISMYILSELDVSNITQIEFQKLDYIVKNKSGFLENSLGRQELEKLRVLRAVSVVLSEEQAQEAVIASSINQLSKPEWEQAQAMLQFFLRDRIGRKHYEQITYAFYSSKGQGGSAQEYSKESKNDYPYLFAEMLAYVHRATKDTGEVYDFLIWAVSQPKFLDKNQNLSTPYKQAVRSFFIKQDKEALKNRSIFKKLMSSDNAVFNKMIKDIRLEQSNALVRFFSLNKRKPVLIGLIIVALLLLTLIVMSIIKAFAPSADPEQIEGTPVPSPVETANNGIGQSPVPSPSPEGSPGASPDASSGVSPSSSPEMSPSASPSSSPSANP